MTTEEKNTDNLSYPLNTVLTFACRDPAHHIKGNKSVKCLPGGKWTEFPTCHPSAQSPLPITVVMLPVVVLVTICLCNQFRSKSHLKLKRNREYDAFVCYRFDTDNDFVMQNLKQNLEPKFQLFIHSLDFQPGLKVSTNILHGIKKSNCAVIVVSNGFVVSQWCIEEFEFCYRESRNDPAFKLLVILMQLTGMLNLQENTLIKYYLENNTYLESTDSKLWDKVARHLSVVKKDSPQNSCGCCQNRDEKEETMIVDCAETAL